jgi:integrase
MYNTQAPLNMPTTLPPEMKTVVQIVLNSLPSKHTQRNYLRGMRSFLAYWLEKGQPIPDKLFLQTYIFEMREKGVGDASINIRLCAIKYLAREAGDLGVWPESVTLAFSKVKKIPLRGTRNGIWLTLEQTQRLIDAPDVTRKKGLRDRAVLSVMLGCGLRRSEIASLRVDHIQKRSHVWVLANVLGKRNKIRTVIIPAWTKTAIDAYLAAYGITSGFLFKPLRKNADKIDRQMNPRTIERIVKIHGAKCGLPEIAPHDLRRTYAKLAYQYGARLDQIQINLGHQSLTTTQKYLGIELDLDAGPGTYLDIKI